MTGMNSDISNSSGPGSSAEPSMEEILASIRRILKEDDRGTPARLDIDDDVLVLDESMRAASPDLSSATVLPAEPDSAPAHAVAGVTSYHNELHIASEAVPMSTALDTAGMAPSDLEEARFAAPVAPAPEPAGDADDETARVPDYGIRQAAAYERALAVHERMVAAHEPDPELAGGAPAPSRPAPDYETATFTPPDEAALESDMENIERPDALVSEAASEAAKSSIGALIRSVSHERSVAVSRGGITIEDIVREEIRPMLKAWLDSHLPALVERIVRAEIERVVDRTQL
jgi:cell pole-organizing protein PopZ